MTDIPQYRQRALECPCGELLLGVDEDALVEIAMRHLSEEHPGRTYTRQEILFMSY